MPGLQWAVLRGLMSVFDRGEHLPSEGVAGEEGLGTRGGRRGSGTPAWLEMAHQEWRG